MASRTAEARMIYWSISNCKQLARCSLLANLIFTWGIPNTDNVGRMEGDPELIKGNLFPYHEGVKVKDIDSALKELHKEKLIIWYLVGENRYIQYPNFTKYQKLRADRTYTSRYPEPPSAPNMAYNDESAPGITQTEEPAEESPKEEIQYKEIIDYFNIKAKTAYKHNGKETQDCIRARWNEGYRVEHFKVVIDKKVAEWDRDPGQDGKDTRAWIRPKTLFGTKFESYLNQNTEKTPGAISKNKPKYTQQTNFEQREYGEEYYENFFENTSKKPES